MWWTVLSRLCLPKPIFLMMSSTWPVTVTRFWASLTLAWPTVLDVLGGRWILSWSVREKTLRPYKPPFTGPLLEYPSLGIASSTAPNPFSAGKWSAQVRAYFRGMAGKNPRKILYIRLYLGVTFVLLIQTVGEEVGLKLASMNARCMRRVFQIHNSQKPWEVGKHMGFCEDCP